MDIATGTAEATVSPTTAPYHPALKKGDWNRKYGRYDYNRFDHLISGPASVGCASIGKVDVDCKFLFKKSKWGLLGERPAGIIYLDLDFYQPKDCQLLCATIQVTLEETTEETRREPTGYPVQMTSYYGPQHIVGPERTQKKIKKLSIKPEAEVMGFGIGGIGPSFETSFEVPHRWKFTGRLIPPDRKTTRVSQYRTLEWQLAESDLEPGQSNKVHTAFAFEHGGEEFLMKVKIKGKLKKIHQQFKENMKSRALKFGPRQNHDGDTSCTLVGIYEGVRRPLDSLARGLERAMEMENHMSRPLELPKPQPAIFWPPQHSSGFMSGPRTNQHANADEQLPNSPPFISSTSPPLPSLKAHSRLEGNGLLYHDDTMVPTLLNLARAGRYLASSPQEIMQETDSEATGLWSTTTLVEGREQSASINKTDAATGPILHKDLQPEDLARIRNALVRGLWLWVITTTQALLQGLGMSP